MRSLKNKIAIFLVCLSTFIVSSGITIFAQENKTEDNNAQISACPPPRTNGTLTDEEVMKVVGISKNTYYKYKRQIREEAKTQG